jgi:tight adherence protein B
METLAGSPLLLVIGLATGGVALCLILAFSNGSGRRIGQRVDRVAARLRGETRVRAALNLRRNSDGGFDTMIRRILPRPDALRDRLTRTGRKIGFGTYALVSLAAALAAMLGAILLGLSLASAGALGVIVGLWLPHLVVGKLIARRIARFEALFPEAIGLIVRGLRSGLPATESMQVVGREIGDPVGEEFRRISDQVRLGQPLDQALGEAAKRIGTAEFNFLVVTMVVQKETGGNLAETLENLDNILRRRRQMKLKIRAMSSEARASAMIIGSLPFLMFTILFVVNRDYVMTLVTTHVGNLLLAGAGCSMGTGIAVIRKLIRFEI